MVIPKIYYLGHSGVIVDFDGFRICIDPYLTDSLRVSRGAAFARRYPPPLFDGGISNVDILLLTNANPDHTDIGSINQVLYNSPAALVVAPKQARDILLFAGVPPVKLMQPTPSWHTIAPDIQLCSVPAGRSEPDRGKSMGNDYVGYLVKSSGVLIYHAGDTTPCSEVIENLNSNGSPHLAFLPINENNYFYNKAGACGNMTLREAFLFADAIGAKIMCPTKWEMLKMYCYDVNEIRSVHRQLGMRFELNIVRAGESFNLVAWPSC